MARLFALILTCLPLLATAAKAAENVSDFTLDNGMQVVVIEDHRAPVVVHMVWYRTGSADEPAGTSGIAHFLEHLMFKATDDLESGEFSATVSRNGGRDNAFTSYDYTAYYQRVAADRLDLMMQMESDRMVNLHLDDSEIATERDVILEERNQRTDNDPSALFREQKNAAQFLNHRYGVPIIGWRHEMEELSRKDALAFYKEHYAPNNAILIVAGDVTPDEVRSLAEKHYGPIPANPDLRERTRSGEPPQIAPRRLVFRDARVAQPWVSRSYLAPERDSGAQREAAALVLASELLGGGQTSLMNERLQFDRKLVVYAGAGYRGTSLDDTTFDLYVVPRPGVTLQEAETAMDEVIAEFLAEPIDTAKLDRIKMQLRASQIYARDNVESMANRYGRALTQGLTVQDVQNWPEILQSITPDEIKAAAERVFDLRKSVTGYLMAEEVSQ